MSLNNLFSIRWWLAIMMLVIAAWQTGCNAPAPLPPTIDEQAMSSAPCSINS